MFTHKKKQIKSLKWLFNNCHNLKTIQTSFNWLMNEESVHTLKQWNTSQQLEKQKDNWYTQKNGWLFSSVQFSLVAQLCPTLCNPHESQCAGLPLHHQLPEFIQTHVHRVSDAIQPSHPLSSSSPPAPNPSQHQSLFQWVNSSHEVAKVLKFQL